MTEVKMPSGATLKVDLAPFAVGKALYQAMLEEAEGLRISITDNLDADFIKNIFCRGMASKKIEQCLYKCMERSLYNGSKLCIDGKIDETLFEPEGARQDYMPMLFEVARVNLFPFTKSLFAELKRVTEMIQKGLV